jgi:(p)ppGpp synthase/HD superfamily hydrolase
MTILGDRFEEALLYAAQLHSTQRRKGTTIPYVSHLLAVASLVIEAGGDEDQAIGALLHDAVEDQGGPPAMAQIQHRFGDRVAQIVAGCTDTDQDPKPPWPERKAEYLKRLDEEQPDVLLVSLADKVHNARAVLADLGVIGDELWSRFTGTKEQELGYYRRLADTFRRRLPCELTNELDRVVSEIERIATAAPAREAD